MLSALDSPILTGGDGIMTSGYCMKCKTAQEMQGATPSKMKNGRDCVTGKCGTCGTKMFKIGKM